MPENEKIIKAEDAVEGRVYLSSVMKYKIKIIKKFFVQEGVGKSSCQRVTVSSDSYPGVNIDISGGTELIEFNSEQYIPYPNTPTSHAKTKVGKQPNNNNNIKEHVMSAESKMGKPRMSKIIYPMLESGNFTAEQIAEEVVKEFPERGGENLPKLLGMIKGQYSYDVKKKLQQNVTHNQDETGGNTQA